MAIRAFADAKRAMAGLLAVVGLTISGALTISSGGSFTNNSTATSTFAGAVSSTRFIADDGSATNPAFTFNGNLNSGMYLSGGNLELSVAGSRKVSITSSATTLFGNLISDSNGRDIGGASSGYFRDLYLTGTASTTNLIARGTVTSTEFVVPSGGGLTFNGSGSVGSGTLQLCFDDGSDLCNDGITMLGVDTLVQVSNGAENIRYLPGQTQFSGGVYSRTDGGNDLGIPALRWRNAALSGTVTSSQAVVTGITTGTSIGTVCVDANKQLILCP